MQFLQTLLSSSSSSSLPFSALLCSPQMVCAAKGPPLLARHRCYVHRIDLHLLRSLNPVYREKSFIHSYETNTVLKDAFSSIPHSLLMIRGSNIEGEISSSDINRWFDMDNPKLLYGQGKYIHLLYHCVDVRSLIDAMHVHDSIVRSGIQPCFLLYKALLNAYYNLGGGMKDVYLIFLAMPTHDAQCYNIMMSCYLKYGHKKEALRLSDEIMRKHIHHTDATFVILLKACSSLEDLMLVHTLVIECSLRLNIFVGSTLLDLYAKMGNINDARNVFSSMKWCNTVSWSSMIAGLVQCSLDDDAFEAFHQMQHEGVELNEVTFVNILRSCIGLADFGKVQKLHAQILEGGFECLVVSNALIDAYAKCRSMTYAHLVFDCMVDKNVISWTTLILGYAHHGRIDDSLNLFWKMEEDGVKPNHVTFSVVLKLCSCERLLDLGKKIHASILRSKIDDCVSTGNCLIDMYIKCGDIENARLVFGRMKTRDVISWSGMIGGYAQLTEPDEAFELFKQMLDEEVKPNEVTYIYLLQACANLATLEQGRRIHGFIVSDALEIYLFVGNTLIDMYCKGGTVKDAHKVFNGMLKRDLISWNALLAGYCQHGHASEAFELFQKMSQEPLNLDHVTFLSLLSVCRHVGLVEEGRHYFDMMTHTHHIKPNGEHCACMVDLLGRAGCLQEALLLIYKLSNDSVMVWMALLGACRISANIHIAEIAAESILKLAPENTAACVMLSNIYAATGR